MASIKGDEKVLLERHLGQGPTYISMGQSEVVLLGTHWELEEHVDTPSSQLETKTGSFEPFENRRPGTYIPV